MSDEKKPYGTLSEIESFGSIVAENLSPSEQARELPHASGVYLMKDKSGAIIYVGKAKKLKKRMVN